MQRKPRHISLKGTNLYDALQELETDVLIGMLWDITNELNSRNNWGTLCDDPEFCPNTVKE